MAHYAEFETEVTVTMTKKEKFVTDEIEYGNDIENPDVSATEEAFEHSTIGIGDCLEELKAYIKKELDGSTSAARRTHLMNVLDTISGWDIEVENTEPEFSDWAG